MKKKKRTSEEKECVVGRSEQSRRRMQRSCDKEVAIALFVNTVPNPV